MIVQVGLLRFALNDAMRGNSLTTQYVEARSPFTFNLSPYIRIGSRRTTDVTP